MLRSFIRDGETLIAVGRGDRTLTFRPQELGLSPNQLRFLEYPPSYTVPAWREGGRADFSPLWTDAILVQWFEGGQALGDPEILPYQFLPFPPGAGAVNYAQSVFEGCKAYVSRGEDGSLSLRLFRIADAARRMALSARRMALEVPEDSLLDLFQQQIPLLLKANLSCLASVAFDPKHPDCAPFYQDSNPQLRLCRPPPALYIRPVLCGWGPVLGVKPSGRVLFYAHVTPVGPYREAMRVALSFNQRRAVPHGTGSAKAAANYAGTLNLYRDRDDHARLAPSERYDDFLFIDRDGNLEELSGANVFVATREGDTFLLRTPPYREGPSPSSENSPLPSLPFDQELDANTFLNGMTRRTVLTLARILGFQVREEHIPMGSLLATPHQVAVFATGTAATIAPITHLGSLDNAGWRALGQEEPPHAAPLAFASWQEEVNPLIQRLLWLKHALLACQYGIPNEINKIANAPGISPQAVEEISTLSERLTTRVSPPLPL